MLHFILLVFLFSISSVMAKDLPVTFDALTLDEPIANGIDLEFVDDDEIEPKVSDFKIVSSLQMSNRVGERWVTITLENTSSQQRLLDKEHIVAVFANGKRRNPVGLEHKFSGKEKVTKIINFGISKFPVLKVYVRN